MPAEKKKPTRRKKGRRAHGEGGCYFHARSGKWAAVIDYGAVNGRRKRRWFYADTESEAREKRDEALRAKAKGTELAPARATVDKMMAAWLESIRITVRKSTHHSYSKVVAQVVAEVGHIRLGSLNVDDVRAMMVRLTDKGLSVRSVRYARGILRMALAQAVVDQKVGFNATDGAKAPKLAKRKPTVFSAAEVAAILGAAAGDRLEALYWLVFTTGARQGEILGAQAGDFDLTAGTWRLSEQLSEVGKDAPVRAPLKVDGGERTIRLDPVVVDAIKRRLALGEEEAREGKREIPAWVFPDSAGGPLRKSNFIRREWAPLLARAKVRRLPFHATRHTVATTQLQARRNPVDVARDLGWEDTAMLLKVYGHATEGTEGALGSVMTAWIRSAAKPEDRGTLQ